MSKYPNTRCPLTNRTPRLRKFREEYNLTSHNMFFSCYRNEWPSQSRRVYTLPKLMANYMSYYYVLWLDISVGNLIRMQVLHSRRNFFYLSSHLNFRQRFLFLKMGEQGALFHVFHQQVNVARVIEAMVEGHDVLMVQISLDFKLQNQLVNHIQLFHIFLWYFFHSKYGASRLMKNLVDCSEPAFSQELPHHKLINQARVADDTIFSWSSGRQFSTSNLFDYARWVNFWWI